MEDRGRFWKTWKTEDRGRFCVFARQDGEPSPVLFNRIRLKSNKLVTSLATSTFSVYLLNSTLLVELFDVEKHVSSNGFLMLGYLVLTCLAVCVISYLAQLLYDLITRPIYKLWDKWFPKDIYLTAE